MAQPLDALERRLADGARRAVARLDARADRRPRLGRARGRAVRPAARGADVRDAANGWIRITDALLDADRDAQARLARELSDRLGAVVVALAVEQGAVVRFRLYERGRMVDEYLSVPTFYGELPKGDELALAANPTLVARLTGADREEVRRVARTGCVARRAAAGARSCTSEIARLMGLEP